MWFVLAENFSKLPAFLDELDKKQYGNASRAKLCTLMATHRDSLELELAAMLDMRELVKTTYELEGDRLELLLVYDRIERLRKFGDFLRSNQSDGLLPNVDATLRARIKLVTGAKLSKYFNVHGQCAATVIGSRRVESTLYPGVSEPRTLVVIGSEKV
ncbi:MAG: hypothetical protein SGPRY_014297 [Prymnesium sp.]